MAVVKDRPDTLLEISDLTMSFGGIMAVSQLALKVLTGEIYSIIGPNGAGKTTLFNCISGIYKARAGSIKFEGQEILGMPPHKIARLGIARAFQNIELFRGMTVLDNLMSSREHLLNYGLFSAALHFGRCSNQEEKCRDRVEDIIELLDLQKFRNTHVGALSYGIQKRVELGRALTMEPKVVLVDEPVSGMNLEETEDMARYILDINEEMRITVVLIEHDMRLVMDLSDRVAVLNFGLKIAEGRPEEIAKDPEVIRAYLGESKN
ncbi:MAG: ABC transporter ATP-binding protein [Desulfomonile tiedjei]|uniref:ABC transporter ATP-binding protein n=1 Tax=Desulfomonile tiedjei TaxID=2358 RepID=A0A9D6V3Z0_9BACT|nr:ABC transporter ATP-binding protein [Desulfomonile tiedjei]